MNEEDKCLKNINVANRNRAHMHYNGDKGMHHNSDNKISTHQIIDKCDSTFSSNTWHNANVNRSEKSFLRCDSEHEITNENRFNHDHAKKENLFLHKQVKIKSKSFRKI